MSLNILFSETYNMPSQLQFFSSSYFYRYNCDVCGDSSSTASSNMCCDCVDTSTAMVLHNRCKNKSS